MHGRVNVSASFTTAAPAPSVFTTMRGRDSEGHGHGQWQGHGCGRGTAVAILKRAASTMMFSASVVVGWPARARPRCSSVRSLALCALSHLISIAAVLYRPTPFRTRGNARGSCGGGGGGGGPNGDARGAQCVRGWRLHGAPLPSHACTLGPKPPSRPPRPAHHSDATTLASPCIPHL